ncbi:transcriptional regulator ATRX homolog [Chenopodium quinoa]|uniref:transcriptional regulator ATRX homolog n=1 Tax=Chenopodium quinoa TaxID=63459 RepID=UPI000B7791F9|nr:transcriptional regulator ATRX homolog [Chenopodium quinoa]
MGKSSKKTKKISEDDSDSQSPSSSTSDESDRRRRRRHRDDDDDEEEVKRSSRREKEKRRRKRKREEKEERKHRRDNRSKRRSRSRKKVSDSDDSASDSDSDSSGDDFSQAKDVARGLLLEFPGVAADLKQLLQMIDDGQAVDIKGISEKPLMKHLKKLFLSLNLKEKGDRVFLLRSRARPTLEIVGPVIASQSEVAEQKTEDPLPSQPDEDVGKNTNDVPSVTIGPTFEGAAPRRRVIGPEMPSAELLAAAAKLTEAQAELRDAEMEQDDNGIFVGPPPPALVTEAESSNEAERFEEVTRIMGVESDNPYDIVGVNHKMPAANIKKRYWKLSLMVHPDKCSHPQANQAFIKLNKGFKDLQDPDKRKALDDKIKKKEEEEEMKAELRSMREAALWRQSQGLAMEGDDVLLAELEVKAPPKRDEWMTSLPPERKPGGMPTHTTTFSRTAKEGRGDTSAWTDTPSDRAQKAKTNYLEAYNVATALASNELDKKTSDIDAALVDQYNKAKRSKTLVQKHQEESQKSHSKKKSKQTQKQDEGEWVGKHPWKPWDREKDLSAGRQDVKLDAENLKQGLSTKFASGSFQRSFL